MNLRHDDRGRVPFALVGVVLLVSSAAYTGALATTGPVPDRTPAERALARSQTAVHVAVEHATLQASESAGEHPLTTPADTPMGRVLQGSDPFERYLRLLVYRQSRRALRNVSARGGDVRVTPSLPAIRGAEDARWAIERTTLDPVDDGRRLRVTIENVSYVLHRDGEPVATHRAPVSVVVASPILNLHRRTAAYEQQLDTGPLEGPGLGRRVTARLWATTQTRGLAQYGGAPIANVLPNRHVELQTNAAAVALQRETFGRADPESATAQAWATARVGIHDGVAALSVGRDTWSERVLSHPSAATPSAATAALDPPPTPPSRTVDPAKTADRALVSVLDGGTPSLENALVEAYSIDARLVADTEPVSTETTLRGTRPIGGVLVDTSHDRTRDVRPATDAGVDPGSGFTAAETVTSRVVETHQVEQTWRTPTGIERVVETRTTIHRVTLGVATRYEPALAPSRPVTDSPGLRRLRSAAVRELFSRPGPDALATRALDGDLDTTVHTISVTPPPAVRDSARRAVLDTYRRTQALTVATNGSGTTNGIGADALAAAIRANRSRLIDTPTRYTSPAAVARTAARASYLDAITAELETDRSSIDAVTRGLSTDLSERGLSVPMVSRLDPPARSETGSRVSTTPTYLPITEVTPAMTAVDEASHPLAARNVNLFTAPSGDVADTITDGIAPESTGSVDLAVAARTLVTASDKSLPPNETLARDRRELAAHVEDATETVAASQVHVLARETPLSQETSSALVDQTLDTYPTTGTRGLAAANGTLSTRLAARAGRRTTVDATVLAARLRVAATAAREEPAARVPERSTKETEATARALARAGVRQLAADATDRAVDRAKQRALAKTMAKLPAGLPVAPVPGSWYATVNVWVVEVRGAYHRFEVRSVVASPTVGPDGLSYAREAASVRLDVDDDGTAERLGRVEPVAFSVRTVIVVAVPPGPRGVGDTDGNADERSPGWPGPAAAQPSPRNETQTTPPTTGSP